MHAKYSVSCCLVFFGYGFLKGIFMREEVERIIALIDLKEYSNLSFRKIRKKLKKELCIEGDVFTFVYVKILLELV